MLISSRLNGMHGWAIEAVEVESNCIPWSVGTTLEYEVGLSSITP